jgi:hypothetical protein
LHIIANAINNIDFVAFIILFFLFLSLPAIAD